MRQQQFLTLVGTGHIQSLFAFRGATSNISVMTDEGVAEQSSILQVGREGFWMPRYWRLSFSRMAITIGFTLAWHTRTHKFRKKKRKDRHETFHQTDLFLETRTGRQMQCNNAPTTRGMAMAKENRVVCRWREKN